jgi:hypothetical protein
MPHTSYGLLKAIRSHTITSPDIAKDLQARRPNACNLCHLDKTLQWSAAAMQQWYGNEIPELSEDDQSLAASVLWLLQGDAGQRALAAWSFGWSDAQQASGNQWMAPILAELLADPYPAVRIMARRSLRSLPALRDLSIDAIAPEADRVGLIQSIRKTWHRQTANDRRSQPQVLVDRTGVQMNRMSNLKQKRDDRPVDLLE